MIKKTILVIDDSKETTELFQHMLGSEGYCVLVANSGNDGLLKIEESKPDLVILDILMPEMNGFDVLAEIRKNPQTRDTCVIMLTAKGHEADVQKGLDLGVKDYVSKPFHVGLLLKRIKRLLTT